MSGSRSGSRRGRRPTALDLYAGAGGLSLGLEQAGFDLLGAVEKDPIHALTHRFNFPRTPILCRDLSEVTAHDLWSLAEQGWSMRNPHSAFGGVDAIVGGPPCQGFSVGGVRHVDDNRNHQLLRFVDLVVELRPAVFCLENVAGLREPRFDGLRAVVFSKLSDAGYKLSGTDDSVNAVDFGVPQSRKRVIVLGGLAHMPRLDAPSTPVRVTVGEALEGLPDPSRYRRLLNTDHAAMTEQDVDTQLGAKGTYARLLNDLISDPDDLSYPRTWDPELLTCSLRTVHSRTTVQRFRRTDPGTVEVRSRLYRLAEDGVSRTLRAGTGADRGSHTSPRPIHPTKDRVITVREAARLHGFPDWFRFHATNWHGHRQVGNSVPPQLAAAAGRALASQVARAIAKPTHPLPLGDPSWLRSSRIAALETLRAEVGASPERLAAI